MTVTTVPSVYVENIKNTVTIINDDIEDVKDKWIGDNNSGLEKLNIEGTKRGLKL